MRRRLKLTDGTELRQTPDPRAIPVSEQLARERKFPAGTMLLKVRFADLEPGEVVDKDPTDPRYVIIGTITEKRLGLLITRNLFTKYDFNRD